MSQTGCTWQTHTEVHIPHEAASYSCTPGTRSLLRQVQRLKPSPQSYRDLEAVGAVEEPSALLQQQHTNGLEGKKGSAVECSSSS